MAQLGETAASAVVRLMSAATFDEVLTLLDRIPPAERDAAAGLLRWMDALKESAGADSDAGAGAGADSGTDSDPGADESEGSGYLPRMAELHEFLAQLCLSGLTAETAETADAVDAPPSTTVPAPPYRTRSSDTAAPPGSAAPPVPPRTPQLPAPPADFLALLTLAARAPGMLAAHRTLRAHRALLPDEPVREALALMDEPCLVEREFTVKQDLLAALTPLSESPPDRLTGLCNWARALVERKQARRALFHASRAVALQEAAGDDRSLLPAYLALAAAMADLGDRAEVRRVLNHALVRAHGRPAASPHDAANAHTQLAALCVYQDVRYQEALDHLDAVQTLRERGARPPLSEPELRELQARAWEGVGAYGAAVRTFRQLLAEAAGDGTGDRRRQLTLWLARCTAARGRHRESRQILLAETARTDAEAAPQLPQIRHLVAKSLLREAAEAPEGGHEREARLGEAAHWLVLCLFDSAGRHLWGSVGEAFLSLADLAVLDGDPANAVDCLRDALVMTTGAADDDEPHPLRLPPRALAPFERAAAEGVLGARGNDLGESLAFVCHRVRVSNATIPQVRVALTRVRLLALQRLARIAPTDRERGLYEAELTELYTAALAEDAWYVVRDLCLPVADLLAAAHGPAAAERHLRATLAAAERHDRSGDTVGMRLALARLLAARPARRQEAFDQLWECRGLLLGQRANDHGAYSWQEWAGQTLPVHEELLALLLGEDAEQLRLPDHRAAPWLAFELHEEVKSRGIVEDRSRLPLPRPASVYVDPELLASEAGLLPGIRRLLREADRAEPGRGQARGTALLDGMRRSLAEKAAEIGRAVPRHARLRLAEGIGLDGAFDLVEAHAPAEGLVLASYFIGERHSFCFVIASGERRLRVYPVPTTRSALHGAADTIRRTVDGDPTVFPPRPKIHPRRPVPLPLDGLRDLLPFQDVLAGRELLCVAPHGPLSVLPLHAVRLADGSHLAERAALVYTPSVSTLEYLLLDRPARPERVLRVDVASLEDLAATDTVQGFDDSVPEALEGPRTTVLTGTAATPRSVLKALGEHDLAYIACHGHSGDGEPGDAALILTDGHAHASMHTSAALPDALPFLLRAGDIGTTSTTPDTVVLRACSAGWHDPAHLGEDFTGLTQALFREGTKTVVAPVWRVNQHSSAELLDGIARERMAGVPLWRALRDAQRRLMTDAERPWLAHPYHWAGFIPLGDWR
ncbi:CHAT domain-containing protein [Streptomyces sp. NPDC087300]|uniref:CHAT domain-containing protein n=1 Tax=Streptomyces sp. NPDC087300 TaxID=3365780 RepID=UPI0038017C0D